SVSVPAAKWLARKRMLTLQHAGQLTINDFALEADGRASRAPPTARRLLRVDVVADRALARVSDELGVVGHEATHASSADLQGRDSHHDPGTAHGNAIVCRT